LQRHSPKVLVIIPVFNREHLIGRAIESVIAQTYQNWELIVSDDHSTDGTMEIIKGYASKDDRIRYAGRLTNGGNAAARNQGLDHVDHQRHQYVAFLDSDDAYLPELLERSIAALENTNPDIGFSWVAAITTDLDGTTRRGGCWKPNEKYWDNPLHFFYELHIGTGRGLVLKSECISDQQRFDENIRTAVDTDFLVRLRQQWKYTYVDDNLILRYEQRKSVRRDTRSKMEAYGYMIDKYDNIIQSDPVLTDRWNYKYLWLCLHNQNWKGAHQGLNNLKNRRTKAWAMYMAFRLLPLPVAKRIHNLAAS
jgi:glycosyltransferase involved in cell wall biosynthesis